MHDAPRSPSFLPRAVIALGRAATVLPAIWSVAAVGAGLVVVATVDTALGGRVSPFPFYLGIAGFAAWRLGERIGLTVAFAAIALAMLVAASHADVAEAGWSRPIEIAAMLFLVVLVVALRTAFEQQRWRATHDPLTGALNRAAFLDRLCAAASRIGRSEMLVIACIDLDGFKDVNDRLGHAAGDRVLRDFAAGAAASAGRSDLIARIGGDEFAMLLTVPAGNEGARHAACLQPRLAAILGATGHTVTCSIGAVLLSASRRIDPVEIVAVADTLMYEAKHLGKNRIRVARAPSSIPADRDLERPGVRDAA